MINIKDITHNLIEYINKPYETEFDKFISNGINTFIRKHDTIKHFLNTFINENMIKFTAEDILTEIILNPKLHTAQTQSLIEAYKYFARKMLVSYLFDPPQLYKHDKHRTDLQNSKNLERLRNYLMTNSYFDFPKFLVNKSISLMLSYIRNSISKLRKNRFQTYVTGHFIESIITDTKYYSTYDSLRRCVCVDKVNKTWLYTEEDFDNYAKNIERLIKRIEWSKFKGNCYLYSTFPFVYVDYHVKLNHTEEELLIHFNELCKIISTTIHNFKLFKSTLKGYINSILLLSSSSTEQKIVLNLLPKYKIIKFKGSVITNTPLVFENDMITKDAIIELKTGSTDVRKNMSKLILENIILQKYKNIIIFNPRSNSISFISANSFKNLFI